jgi:hypothetical protein
MENLSVPPIPISTIVTNTTGKIKKVMFSNLEKSVLQDLFQCVTAFVTLVFVNAQNS